MVGGGPDSFIGKIHARAAQLDGQIELVCGAFDINPDNSKLMGKAYYLEPSRAYDTFQEMIAKEKELPEGERMDMLAICTPNHVHFEPARLALENGFHVVSDKPLTNDTDDARELVRLVEKTGLVFAVTHAYTGYPMVKEARGNGPQWQAWKNQESSIRISPGMAINPLGRHRPDPGRLEGRSKAIR